MAPRIPDDDLPYDANGIREYGVMLHASAAQNRALRRFHAEIGLTDFSSRAHVSIHNFGEPQSLGEVMVRLSKLAIATAPIKIELDPDGAKPWGEGLAGGFKVSETDDLMAFNAAVNAALDPVTKSPRAPGRKFWPHLTAYLATDAHEAELAKKLLKSLNLGKGYVARSVQLTGRRGPARGGNYTTLATFHFGGLRVGPTDPPM